MSIADVIHRFRQVEQAKLAASAVVLADWAQAAEQLMQTIAPTDDGDHPTDWYASAVHPAANGASVDLIYRDPLGVLSVDDQQYGSEDLATILRARATLGPDLVRRLRAQVWS